MTYRHADERIDSTTEHQALYESDDNFDVAVGESGEVILLSLKRRLAIRATR